MQEVAALTWDALYDELLSFVYARVKDKSTAQDIVQDVFIFSLRFTPKGVSLERLKKFLIGYIKSLAMRSLTTSGRYQGTLNL